eukprot:1881873-Rhodomonas_salina.2
MMYGARPRRGDAAGAGTVRSLRNQMRFPHTVCQACGSANVLLASANVLLTARNVLCRRNCSTGPETARCSRLRRITWSARARPQRKRERVLSMM